MSSSETLVLAFGGRPETAAAIRPLADATGAQVVTVTLDLGQGEDLAQISAEALAAGAVRAHVVDARERFGAEVLQPALRAGATSEVAGIRAAALARPVVAAVLAEVAAMERATRVAHGATGTDRKALNRLLHDLNPALSVVPLPSHGARDAAAPRIAANLWGRTVVLAPPADLWTTLPPSLFARTSEPAACAAHEAVVDLTFERGQPVAVNGIAMTFAEIVEVVDTIAGDHAVGRTEVMEGSPAARRREVVEAPAALTLAAALADLERAALDPDTAALKRQILPHYTAFIDEGGWFSPARRACDALLESAATAISGTVRVMLFRGACRVVGRQIDASAGTGLLTSGAASAI